MNIDISKIEGYENLTAEEKRYNGKSQHRRIREKYKNNIRKCQRISKKRCGSQKAKRRHEEDDSPCLGYEDKEGQAR